MTHLVVDEVHERNADVDLLLALSKQAQMYRHNHPTIPPLQITLMSATLETGQWETYFDKHGHVEAVDVPDARRFPIDIIHVDSSEFPNLKGDHWLRKGRTERVPDLDEKICKSCAELATHVIRKKDIGNGSILCFLPGMDEIRQVEYLLKKNGITRSFDICLLHSSLSSKEQNKVFQPGPKVILSTNIAETSLTIPDVKVIIDSGRERQYSLLESSSNDRNIAVVGSQLATVDISQAAAKQRAGRAGRVSAGVCYRLYTQQDFDSVMPPTTLPEMERMELSQLILHSLSLYHPDAGHPLSLLLGAPSPPSHLRLTQTLHAMRQQGFLRISRDEASSLEEMGVALTPLGQTVSTVPASPRIGRMLFMGLVLRAADPALTMAALLSVPKAFDIKRTDMFDEVICSDLVMGMNSFHEYIKLPNSRKQSHPRKRIYEQVVRVRNQLENAVRDFAVTDDVSWEKWNTYSDRLAAQVSLICCATPHIAHLTSGRRSFATRDVTGNALMHPSSVNFDHGRRTHWYLYHELRQTSSPYLHVTTAVAPLEVALFGESSGASKSIKPAGADDESEDIFEGTADDWNEDWESADEWIYIIDQWVPVCVPTLSQRKLFMNLRRILNYEMLQRVASRPSDFIVDGRYEQLLLNVLSCIEHERVPT
jgi:HrpA-like RNA helicase